MVFHWESLTANALAFVSLGEQKLLSGVALILLAVVTPTTDKTNELPRTGLTRAYFATLRSITGEFRASTRPSGVTH